MNSISYTIANLRALSALAYVRTDGRSATKIVSAVSLPKSAAPSG
jgi:hypothetical protein